MWGEMITVSCGNEPSYCLFSGLRSATLCASMTIVVTNLQLRQYCNLEKSSSFTVLGNTKVALDNRL